MKEVAIDIKQTLHVGVHRPPEPLVSKAIAAIDRIGDECNHTTNVKATMTSYWSHLHHYDDFKELYCWLDKLICSIPEVKKKVCTSDSSSSHPALQPEGQNRHFFITNFWGMKYSEGNEAAIHAHDPSLYSFVYYLKVDNPSKILFCDDTTEMKARWSVTPRDHTLIIFPGHLRHQVEKQEEGERYAVSGNFYIFDRSDRGIQLYIDFSQHYPEILYNPL